MTDPTLTPEQERLEDARRGSAAWKQWGPYLSERQWGTVREDYSTNGDAWSYFPHDHARSRAYRWGEDGLAGISDDHQRLCFGLALWNGADPILKERLFGLANGEGNHGEDVKEYYFYLDSTPTHSYMRYLYKYPQAAFPYTALTEGNRRRNRHELEYELIDTGVFDDNRYFDVFVEYAKAGPADVLAEITVANRGREAARACVLPTLWFRNTWFASGAARPHLEASAIDGTRAAVVASHPELGEFFMLCDGTPALLFTENETNTQRLFGQPNQAAYVKDGINDAVVQGRAEAVNPGRTGTKVAARYDLMVPPGGERAVRVRIADAHLRAAFGEEFDDVMRRRRAEADRYYAAIIPSAVDGDTANIMRQALAGMLWTKQFYAFEGGFLGLDNIGVFDRSAALPTGGHLEQADGTAWMGFFCQNMVEIAAELATHKPSYGEMLVKFVEHFLWIATAMMHAGGNTGMWDEEDGFFYDVLRMPDGHAVRLKVRSMVGLLPLCAATVFEGDILGRIPGVRQRLRAFLDARPEIRTFIHDPVKYGSHDHLMLSILDERNLRRVLKVLLDEREFLSPYGVRALSRHHAEHPYSFSVGDREYRVAYTPGESDTSMFGGNSNWRGPVWMPVNTLIIRALLQYFVYYGDDFKVECPTGCGRQMTLYEVAEELSRRLGSIFRRDARGSRPVYGGTRVFQDDPHWRDLILFYEYFQGDDGAGLGASHQTGWTGVIALLMQIFATSTPDQYRKIGRMAGAVEAGRVSGVSDAQHP